MTVVFLICSHVSQLWEALGKAKRTVSLQVLAELLEMLKRRPCFKKSETSESRSSFEASAFLLPLAVSNNPNITILAPSFWHLSICYLGVINCTTTYVGNAHPLEEGET